MTQFVINIPDKGYFVFWKLSVGGKLETSDDPRKGCMFENASQAMATAQMLTALLNIGTIVVESVEV